MPRDPEERGKLWQAFQQTEWAIDLNEFFAEQEKDSKAKVCELAMAGKAEEAKNEALKLAGILMVKDYMSDSVRDFLDSVDEKEEERAYKKRIPRHVR